MQHFLQKKGRDEGTRILAGRGTGKSILLSRIAMHDFAVCNRGTAVYDTGHTIDNILLDIAAQPAAIRQQLWKRVRYVNMGGMDDRIIPWPILFRFANEPNAEVYERFIAAIQRVNPELVNPARQGMNAVRRVGGYVCDILLNRGLQLDSAEAIMLDKLFPEKKDMDAFREKVQDITRHPVTKAMYTTTPQGFTWQQVENEKLLVLIDLRDIRRDALRFAMVWVFWNLVDYIELHRPSHNTPLSIIIDELSVLMKTGSFLADKQAADDMNELLNKTMRHKNIFLTVAHQQAVQFPGLIGKLLSDNRNCR